MDKHQIKELLYKYEKGTCTELEKAQLETWYLQQEIPQKLDLTESELDTELKKIWNSLEKEYVIEHRGFSWKRLAVAASILFVLGIGLYHYIGNNREDTSAAEKAQIAANDIKPGENKAIYIDPTGKQQELKEEVFIVPKRNEDLPSSGRAYNTIITPKGGQYQVVLEDGTHVWLNAASSLKYPDTFNEKERVVELTGEAYFEVAHMAAKPFKVVSKDQLVEVLGTHFNVNTYLDEPDVKTTLLEGSVKVSPLSGNHKSGLILKPGEQAVNTTNRIVKSQADTEEAIAWKNGFFQFEDASLETVMRQIARWYDLEVEYNGKISKRVFNGKVYRNMSLSKVLSVLSFSKINYKVEGKKLIVTP